jgi:hypothetical protein
MVGLDRLALPYLTLPYLTLPYARRLHRRLHVGRQVELEETVKKNEKELSTRRNSHVVLFSGICR